MLRGQSDGLDDVARSGGTHDGRGAFVDHRVPKGSRFVVPGVAGKAEGASESATKRVDRLR